jgi:hypothetical protein
LVQTMHNPGMSTLPGSAGNSGVMGASLGSSSSPAAATSVPPVAPLQHHSGDQVNSIIPPSMHATGSSHGSQELDHRRNWMPKMDFPKFDGSDVRIWLDKCPAYFHLYSIPPDFRVTATSLHMIDRASNWFQTYKHSPGSHSWEHFVVAVSKEFEVNTH